jgi:hypothetical protein
LKKSFSFTHLKKPSPLNQFKKAVPIQFIWKSRLHSTQPKKPLDHPAALTTQLRWSPSCVDQSLLKFALGELDY